MDILKSELQKGKIISIHTTDELGLQTYYSVEIKKEKNLYGYSYLIKKRKQTVMSTYNFLSVLMKLEQLGFKIESIEESINSVNNK